MTADIVMSGTDVDNKAREAYLWKRGNMEKTSLPGRIDPTVGIQLFNMLKLAEDMGVDTRGPKIKEAEANIKQDQAAEAQIEVTVASPGKEGKGEITEEEFNKLSLEDMEKILPYGD